LITSVGTPVGLSDFNFGMGCGAVRLFNDAAVFCLDEGFPAQAIIRSSCHKA
jgi:hypothetical protein